MSKREEAPFRLAFRSEGRLVNCYFAKPNTMENAVLLSCLPQKLIDAEPALWDAWRKIMIDCLDVMCREVFGTPIGSNRYVEEEGPENEKSGHG